MVWSEPVTELVSLQAVAPQAHTRHAMCGHVVHSAFPMPDLPTCEAIDGPLGRVDVRLGQTPSHLTAGVQIESGVEVSEREVLISVREGGRILIRDGREIIVDVQAGAARNLLPFVLGSGLGGVCLQKGLLTLHASAVDRGGQAIAFAGPSGAGKSTMAAAMVDLGYSHFSDDLSVIRLPANGRAELYPGVPLVKLWPDSASAVGLDAGDAKPELSWHAKLMFDMKAGAKPLSTGLAGVYFLEREERADIVIEPLVGPFAMAALAGEIYRRSWLAPMGRLEGALRQVALLSRQTPCFRIRRPHHFDQLAEVARMAADHHASLTASQVGV